jgi:putative DNA primase/helicase
VSADGYAAYGGAPTPEELARFDLNDYGNALRLIRLAGGAIGDDGEVDAADSRLLYLLGAGWIAFNGRFWDRKNGEDLARRAAHLVAQKIRSVVAVIVAERSLSMKEVMKFADQAGSNGSTSAMLRQAQSYLTVEIDAFDRDPLALNCLNGVVRFARGDDGPTVKFRKGHHASDRMTRMVNASYDPKAPAARFREVVEFAHPAEEMRGYLQRVLGYMATGLTEEQKFFVFQGKGGDGKSTIVNAVRDTLGTYATTAAVETFLDMGPRRGSEASPDIAALAGDTRMISAGEPPSGYKLATGAIKLFTGGGKVKARELHRDLIEFEPIGKPVIECNRRPPINDTDDGVWRRIKIVMFKRQVPPDQVDGTLPAKLKQERDGILNWIVDGVLAWMAEGLRQDPAEVREAVEDYRRGSNPFAQWIRDRLVFDAAARVRASDLYNDYKTWMEENGHDKPMSQKAFGGALGDLQIILAGKDGLGKQTRRGARLRGLYEPDPGDVGTAAPQGPTGAGGGLGGGGLGEPGAFDADDEWPVG